MLRFSDRARRETPRLLLAAQQLSPSARRPRALEKPMRLAALSHGKGAAAPLSSRADFDLPPSVLKPRAGEVTTISRPWNLQRERRRRPRGAAEAKEARSEHPFAPLGGVPIGLGFGRARRAEDAEPNKGGSERDGGLAHVEIPVNRGPPPEA